ALSCFARAPDAVRRAMLAPGPTEPRSFFALGFGAGGGGGGGDETAPTVKLPCMSDGWASQLYLYVPSVNVTVHVTEPTNSMSVAWLTPGPWRSKLWMLAWSFTSI